MSTHPTAWHLLYVACIAALVINCAPPERHAARTLLQLATNDVETALGQSLEIDVGLEWGTIHGGLDASAEYCPDTRSFRVDLQGLRELAQNSGRDERDLVRLVMAHEIVHAFHQQWSLLEMSNEWPPSIKSISSMLLEGHARYVTKRIANTAGLAPAFDLVSRGEAGKAEVTLTEIEAAYAAALQIGHPRHLALQLFETRRAREAFPLDSIDTEFADLVTAFTRPEYWSSIGAAELLIDLAAQQIDRPQDADFLSFLAEHCDDWPSLEASKRTLTGSYQSIDAGAIATQFECLLSTRRAVSEAVLRIVASREGVLEEAAFESGVVSCTFRIGQRVSVAIIWMNACLEVVLNCDQMSVAEALRRDLAAIASML